ncbi:hypothetical protein U1Q18_020803 [Sarracenia purpurea var. burkii]
MVMKPGVPSETEKKKLATWGTDIPDDLVLDQKLLSEAIKKNRRKTAYGYQRRMMKAASNGPAAFGEVEKFDDKESGAGSGRGHKKISGDDKEANISDRGETSA